MQQQKGFKGIIYSGELKPQRVKDWLLYKQQEGSM